MKQFLTVQDGGNIKKLLEEARYVKWNPFADKALGKNKTMLMVFFN